MAEKIVFVFQKLNNYHALNHFLMLIAKVLRSQSSGTYYFTNILHYN